MRASEVLERVAQKSHRCSIPGNIWGQDEWGFEYSGLEQGVLAYGGGLKLDYL